MKYDKTYFAEKQRESRKRQAAKSVELIAENKRLKEETSTLQMELTELRGRLEGHNEGISRLRREIEELRGDNEPTPATAHVLSLPSTCDKSLAGLQHMIEQVRIQI
jgi:chromosome segregation ATPase